MNTCSNIEIVNFDNFENENDDEKDVSFRFYLDNEWNIDNLKKNFKNDNFDGSSADNSDSFNDNRSCSAYSDNSRNFSCNLSLFGDQTNFTENFKNFNLNDSFSQDEKIQSKSFTFKPTNNFIRLSKYSESFYNDDSQDKNDENIIFLNNYGSIGKPKKVESSNLNGKSFDCFYEDCDKKYKSKENLTLHIKNKHLREKPYKCKFCDGTFSHRNGKTYHERKFHTRFLPHKCNDQNCDMTFASKSALTYHYKSQHLNNTARKISRNNKSRFNEKIIRIVTNSVIDVAN